MCVNLQNTTLSAGKKKKPRASAARTASAASKARALPHTPALSNVPAIGNWRISNVFLTPKMEDNAKKNILSSIFDTRVFTTTIKKKDLHLNSKMEPFIPDKNFETHRIKYTLASSKLRYTGSGIFFHRQQELELTYIAQSGNSLETIDVRAELEKIADFASLDTRKAVARLEHLQSPSAKDALLWDDLRANQFEKIEEKGHAGCGFIPEAILENLLGNKALAKSTVALQVRIVGPKLGLLKGMLCRKRGISRIQLPDSMRKVGPSKSKEIMHEKKDSNWVVMLVTQQGVHPSQTNRIFGQHLNQPEVGKSDRQSRNFEYRNKMLSPMIKDVVVGLGIARDTVESYAKAAKESRDQLKHAWLVGVADPTDSIPEGHIFITGMGFEKGKHSSIFITRAPCIEADDGRLLPVVTTKPRSMSKKDWEWLNELAFGVVIFGFPQSKKTTPLPETIAAGDLDGDLYFICWDSTILSQLQHSYVEDSNLDNRDSADESEEKFIDDEPEELWKWEEILEHRKSSKRDGGYELHILWDDGTKTWEPLKMLIGDCPQAVAKYARKHGLTHLPAFRGQEDFSAESDDSIIIIDDSSDESEEELKDDEPEHNANEQYKWEEILEHRKSSKRGGRYELHILWDDETKTWEPLKMLIGDCPQAVAKYARKHSLTHLPAFRGLEDCSAAESVVNDDSSDESDWVNDNRNCHNPGDTWFTKAQDLMLNLPQGERLNRLISYLYKENKNAAKGSKNSIHDEDALAFGRAYKKALELEKHGGKVYLPEHLHERIPKEFRKLLKFTEK